ncbi:YodD family protein [Candidatus Pantoea persica]|uniref:YodD family protein n=1 Tax=Candidatus Pantoea persica TaxID=2518128 RepID=UPI00215DAD2F|nr:YodD family protein [Candidatus Pantoea persica]MBA2814639.1 hypothetical protein [Candidatus Pantoea persica]
MRPTRRSTALLEPLPPHASASPETAVEADDSRHLASGGRAWVSHPELADEYELDIRDCSCNELNR